jgi:hypothetical protein
MAATAGLSLTFNPMGKVFSKRFLSEIQMVSEKKRFETFFP